MRQENCEKYHCETCDYNTVNKNDYTKHLLTRKHKNRNNLDTKSIQSMEKYQEKIAKKFTCEKCNYVTGNKSVYNRHINTRKHLQNTSDNDTKPAQICDICKKQYSSYNSLWKHKKKCSLFIEKPLENTLTESDITNPSTVIMHLIKENQEFKSLLVEQNKKQEELVNKVIELSREPRIVTNGNITQNNNQKHFNLHFFLNETCKDAININEFLKSIEFQLDDLEETARIGYVDGVSRIFIRALKDMEVNKRPIHCTDIKRETVYVKNNDNWEKDNPEKKNLKKAVDYIANKNMVQIDDWKEQNPNWKDYDSEEGHVLNKMYMATTGGGTEEEDTKYVNKIIKNVLQEVVVDKES